jgi:DNA polymerase-3 subunit gamma/tau
MRIYNGIIRFEDDLRASVSEEIAFRMFVFKLSYIHRIKSFKEIIEEIRRGGVEIKETKKKSKEEIFSQIVDFLRQRARDLLADKLQQASYELSDNYLTIFLDDQRIIRSLAEMKEDIEEFIRESLGESITLKLELRKQKEEIDVEKILGDEFEKFEPEVGKELW